MILCIVIWVRALIFKCYACKNFIKNKNTALAMDHKPKTIIFAAVALFVLVVFIILALVSTKASYALSTLFVFLTTVMALATFYTIHYYLRGTALGDILNPVLIVLLIGFAANSLNALILSWKVFYNFTLLNEEVIMNFNTMISSLTIAAASILLFYSIRGQRLFNLKYYKKK